MGQQEAKQRIEKLKTELNHHRYSYHVLDKQEISDAAWDSLKHELASLEEQYPEFITSDSPTQRVGGEPLEKFVKIKHPEPMLSIEDVFNFKELQEWEDYMKDYLLKEMRVFPKFTYFCERKIDGVDIVLIYKKGVLFNAATRGNGLIGEDVTQNIKTIEAIPLRLEKEIDLVVRGEIFLQKKDFQKLNREREKRGLPTYANPRNIAAGSIRQLDPKITAQRFLDCYIFEIITDLGQKTHQQVHEILKQLGFKTDSQTKLCFDLKQVQKYYLFLNQKRLENSFDYDGMVVMLNDIVLQKKLSFIGKSPRWMRAYKFPGEQTTTIIEDIFIQVGRTGVLTPVAKLKPVSLMGTTVSRATLHNQDEIERLDARLGDSVIIEKAGDIIPAVVKVLKNLRTGKEKKFQMPTKCPICNGPIRKKEGEVAYYCQNKNCFASQQRKISYFVSKRCFDIEGLGPKIIGKLLEAGLISDAADLFKLQKGDIILLESPSDIKPKVLVRGFAEKSADNLIKAIDKSKEIELSRFIQALGIRHIGEQMANDLAEYFKSFEKFSQTKKEELLTLSDIGPIASQSIVMWLKNKENQKFLGKLKKYGVIIKNHYLLKAKQILKGKSFVLTGVLTSMSREKAKEKIQSLGGRVLNAVSTKTDFLVSGKNPGSKYNTAKSLRINIINEQEFLKMVR
ncbi:MAG: NAD-dependent DNA ligase LigA [Patescibacteria group bacterium]|nr:NAD-dependent DNA ligase LigA [Patescibacteria group bacterium]